jgi:hypothetical protein
VCPPPWPRRPRRRRRCLLRLCHRRRRRETTAAAAHRLVDRRWSTLKRRTWRFRQQPRPRTASQLGFHAAGSPCVPPRRWQVARDLYKVNHALREHEIEKARVSQLRVHGVPTQRLPFSLPSDDRRYDSYLGRLSILSDFSTQAALLAGASIAVVGAESLDSLEDDVHIWDVAGKAIFIGSSAVAVATSLWVIFIASHLTSLTRDSAMRPKIKMARSILEDNVRDVRGMLWLSRARAEAGTRRGASRGGGNTLRRFSRLLGRPPCRVCAQSRL